LFAIDDFAHLGGGKFLGGEIKEKVVVEIRLSDGKRIHTVCSKGREVRWGAGRGRFRWGLCSLSGRRLRGNRTVLICRVALLCCWVAGNASRCLATPAFAVFAPANG